MKINELKVDFNLGEEVPLYTLEVVKAANNEPILYYGYYGSFIENGNQLSLKLSLKNNKRMLGSSNDFYYPKIYNINEDGFVSTTEEFDEKFKGLSTKILRKHTEGGILISNSTLFISPNCTLPRSKIKDHLVENKISVKRSFKDSINVIIPNFNKWSIEYYYMPGDILFSKKKIVELLEFLKLHLTENNRIVIDIKKHSPAYKNFYYVDESCITQLLDELLKIECEIIKLDSSYYRFIVEICDKLMYNKDSLIKSFIDKYKEHINNIKTSKDKLSNLFIYGQPDVNDIYKLLTSNKNIVFDDVLLNKMSGSVIDTNSVNDILNMLSGTNSDEDLAVNIIINCNYDQSIQALLLLCLNAEAFNKVILNKTHNKTVNHKAFVLYMTNLFIKNGSLTLNLRHTLPKKIDIIKTIKNCFNEIDETSRKIIIDILFQNKNNVSLKETLEILDIESIKYDINLK